MRAIESKLKPCPFCGSTDIVITQKNGFLSGGYAMCRGCFATTRSSIYTDEAVANWNRRPYDGHKCGECAEMRGNGKTSWCTHVRELVGPADEACELFKPKSEGSDKE